MAYSVIHKPRRTIMKIHSSGGGSGHVREFSEHTMLVFTFSQVNDIVRMVNAVIVRSACSTRELKHNNPVPTSRIRELMRPRPGHGGGGATCGPHNVYIDRERQVVWLNAEREIPFDGHNILMLDGIEETCAKVVIAGRDTIVFDISPERLLGWDPLHERAMEQKIAGALLQLSSVKNFCS
jgi:hypothetical protein